MLFNEVSRRDHSRTGNQTERILLKDSITADNLMTGDSYFLEGMWYLASLKIFESDEALQRFFDLYPDLGVVKVDSCRTPFLRACQNIANLYNHDDPQMNRATYRRTLSLMISSD